MRRIRFIVLVAALCASHAGTGWAQTPALLWAKSFGGGGMQYATALAQRGTKLWVGGGFTSAIDLTGASYAAPQNGFIALFNSADGTYQWSKAFDLGGGSLTAVGVDASDNVYITGQFDGTVNFGGSPLTSVGSYDVFLAKYNSTGVHQWSKKFGDVGQDTGLALVVDNGNNVIVGGRFSTSVDFGGGPLVSAGAADAFIAKLTSAGAHVWSQKFGDATAQEVTGLGTASGDVYATGDFFGTINLGGSALTSAGQNDIFLVRFNSAGTHQWSQRYGDSNFQNAEDVDTDGFSVVLLANIQGSVNFGGSTLTSAGSVDVAVARFLPTGAHTWSKIFGDSDTQTASALDLASSSIFITGWFESILNFGHPLSAGASQSNIFVAKLLGGTGAEVWSQSFGVSATSDFGADIISSGTQAWCSGRFNKDANFGYNGALSSPTRDDDAYVAEFGNLSAEPVIHTVKDVPNDQGGKVRVEWARADYDAIATILPIVNYEIYLREDPLNLSAPQTAPADTWLLAGEAPAHGLGLYYALAFTQQDSTLATGMHTSVYKVRAVTDDPAVYFDSPLLGGFSLDDLAPAIPGNFTLASGELSWRASSDSDIAYYTVYGSDRAFDETSELIDYTTTTHMDVSLRAYARYFVTATDRAGNESRPASLDGARAATSLPPRTLSVSAYPNPFNPATTIRYTLPEAGPVRINVYNADGALVATLFDGERAAGAFTVKWDGRNNDAAVAASGVYFVRIEHNGATRAYKLVVLK